MPTRTTAFCFALLTLILPACGLRARSVADVAHDACEMFLVERAEVKQQAQRQKISPAEVARGLCAINDIVRPFLLANREAAPVAVENAQKAGALPR